MITSFFINPEHALEAIRSGRELLVEVYYVEDPKGNRRICKRVTIQDRPKEVRYRHEQGVG